MNNLVFSGCGTIFPAYIGVLQAIEAKNLNINKLALTSGGSIIGALYALGYTSKELKKMILNINFKSLEDKGFIPYMGFLTSDMSMLKGDIIYNLLKTFTENKLILECKKETNIIVTEIINKELFHEIVFNSKQTNISLAYAIRASLSIPLLFKPIRTQTSLLVDGGLLNNFAIDFDFKDDKQIIGFRVQSKTNQDNKVNNTKDMLEASLNALMYGVEKEHREDIKANTKICDIFINYSGFSFDFNKRDIESMIDSGYFQAKEFLKNI